MFQVHQPLPQNFNIRFCDGSFGITITSTSGQSNVLWNMTGDIVTSQAEVILNVNNFPESTAGGSYNVVFNIPLCLNGIFDHEVCYLNLAVDNVMLSYQEVGNFTVSNQGT